ncbi:MAG: isochorismate hydrolase [Candidatus Krumholzibacteriia bacterium]|jgi:isochorismate hydrolase
MSNPKVPDRLTADRMVLVVVDIQEKFRDMIHGMDQVIGNSERMIQFCQQMDIPFIVTEQYPRGLGATVSEIRNICSPLNPVEKVEFSCAANAEFNKQISDLGRDQMVLCGIETHVCIYQTAHDLLRQGKQVALVTDAVSSLSAANRETGLRRLSELGVQSMATQMVMFEVLGKAGTPEFKLVSHLLKE